MKPTICAHPRNFTAATDFIIVDVSLIYNISTLMPDHIHILNWLRVETKKKRTRVELIHMTG